MQKGLLVFIDDKQVLSYQKDNRLPGHQRRFLDQMDEDMDSGISLGAETIEKPNEQQRAQYIASYLVNSLLNDNQNMVLACCAYLSHRCPDLNSIQATEEGENISVSLLFNPV